MTNHSHPHQLCPQRLSVVVRIAFYYEALPSELVKLLQMVLRLCIAQSPFQTDLNYSVRATI